MFPQSRLMKGAIPYLIWTERNINMDNKKKVKRGEIYFYNLGHNDGSVQSGVRPVLVVQCTEGNNASPTTIVAAITTVVKKSHLPSHIYLGQRFGLKYASMVMLEQLRTVNQSELVDYIGTVDDDLVLRFIDNGLKKSLGLWRQKRTGDIRCLCSRCLNVYKHDTELVVKRLDPFSREKGLCEKCSSYGYDYLIARKSNKSKCE